MIPPHFDSRPDTRRHIRAVRANIDAVVVDLTHRANFHDRSKLCSPEVEIFDEFTPKLKTSTFGSEEYEQFRADMGEALLHHYRVNDHHPEHFENGIFDMNLVQLIEMLCDWKAAVERHDDGDIRESIHINQKRFGYDNEIRDLLLNTIDYWEAQDAS